MRKIGYIVMLLAFGLSVYAAPPRRGKMPVAHAPQAVGVPNPVNRVLVILTGYSDLAIQAKNTADALDSLFNVPGYNYNGATGSVRDYFIAQSDGAYQPVFDVVGPITLANTRAYYGSNISGKEGADSNAKQMVKDACQAVDAIVDFSQYDSDGDGKVDAVYIIYAGQGENDGGPATSIWPHQSTASGLTLDGKQIYTYACSGEIDGVTLDRTGIGPICHEFGHAIGMPDYYSTGSSSGYIVGEWSAMDYGMYNNGANTPPNYSLFDKEYMGWTTVEELAVNSQADIVLTTEYGAGYKLTAGDATYYLEYRPLTGWDIGLPGGGMLLWQVKYSQSAWNYNHVNYTAGSPCYTVYSAAKGPITNGDDVSAADPFPGTQNVTGWTAYEGFAITEITETNGQITFKLNGGAPVDPTDVVMANGEGRKANGRKIIRNGQLIIIRGEKEYNAQGAEIR